MRETERRSLSTRGFIICLVAGLSMGSFYLLSHDPCWATERLLLDKVDWFTPNETEAIFFIGNGAAAAAALSVTRPGAQTSMPRMVEVEQMLAGVKPNANSSM